MPDPSRRRVVVAAALTVTAALTGVGVAVQHDDAAPSAAGAPVVTDPGTPSWTTPSTVTDAPSKAVSRSGDRTPEPSATPATSPTGSPETSPTTALPDVTTSPEVGAATASKAPTPSQPSQPGQPGQPSPVDDDAPDTSASTSAVDSDSWTVSVSADEPASYECSLDGGSYQACSATTTFSDLDRGRHSLTTRATDDAGNTDPTPAELTTTVNGGN